MVLLESMPNHIFSSISARRTSSKGPSSSRRSQSTGHTATSQSSNTNNVNNRHSSHHNTSGSSNSGNSHGGVGVVGSGGGRSSRSGTSTPSASPSRPSSPSSRDEQAFHLMQGSHSASPWLTLRVKSNASPSRTHPLYFDKDVVEGSVHLNLSDNPSTVVGVVVFVSCHPRLPNPTPPLHTCATFFPHSSSLAISQRAPIFLNSSLFYFIHKLTIFVVLVM
jgi:hypothetical protein